MTDCGWTALGDRAIRFPRPAVSARAIVREVRAWPGVIDVVVAHDAVAAYFGDLPHVEPARIAALAHARDDEEAVRDIELRAHYNGPDLDDIARATGLSVAEILDVHASGSYVVASMGFSPGFAYMTGLDPRLELPRRVTPRSRVAAGSIAIAGAHTAVYPFDSPGGWHLLGTVVGVRMFDANGSLLRLGDRVRFVKS